jgi:exodeoxyribonuclease VII small subunit
MKNMNFEEALKKLEETVEQLETGDLPLEKALEVFETGIKMSRICTKKLEEAEQKVELLLGVSDDGQPQTTLFDMNAIEE